MKMHCPFLVTVEEAEAIYAATEADLEFYSESPIPAGDYKALMEYIEARPSASVCLRVFANQDFGILDLPLTKSVILLVYLTVEDELDRHDLVAVTGLHPLDGLVEAWRLPALPAQIDIYPESTLC